MTGCYEKHVLYGFFQQQICVGNVILLQRITHMMMKYFTGYSHDDEIFFFDN